MSKIVLVLLAVIVCAYAKTYEEIYLENVPVVNKMQKQWRAGYNRYFKGMDLEVIRKMMGTRMNKIKAPEVSPVSVGAVPTSFDSRTQWPKCTTISHINDQGNCGSCWAVAAGEVASDRTCIGGNAATDNQLSAEQIMSCCTSCGDGCQGGYPISAMEYWQATGVVTGGDYDSNQGCLPYEIKPCGAAGCSGSEANTPRCVQKCEAGYGKTFADDKHMASSHYQVNGGVAGIQAEIQAHGPVEAAFNVYADFMNYKSGVYKHTTGEYLGGHAVKIIGWGVEGSTPYWMVANSWNTSWGMNGWFMIERGTDECGIEDGIVAGLAPGQSL